MGAFPDITQDDVLRTVCRPVGLGNFDLCAVFPGGAEVCAQVESFPPSLLQLARSLLGQANAALAPLGPIFDIIDVLVALQNCIESIPDAIGGRPQDLTACIGDLATLLEKLLRLIPQLSIPLLLVGLLDALIQMLNGVIAELRAVIALIERITRAQAVQVDGLLQLIVCADESRQNQLSNIERLFASINPLINLINTFAKLGGQGDNLIPEFEGGLGDDPEAAIEPLEDLVAFLTELRDSIPV